jgi:DNA-binding MarR family transcriptional regulator
MMAAIGEPGPLDSLDRTRARWDQVGGPKAPQFVALMSILRATAIVTDRVDAVLKDYGLSRRAYLVMITLQMSPNYSRPLGQLSRALLVHPTTVTLVVEQLQNNDLIERREHPSDRRAVLAQLTPNGLEVIEKASASLAEIDFGLVGTGDSEAEQLITDLRRIRIRLGDIA